MDEEEFEELTGLLSSSLVRDRLAGMDRISLKSGRQIKSTTDDKRVVELLIRGLRMRAAGYSGRLLVDRGRG